LSFGQSVKTTQSFLLDLTSQLEVSSDRILNGISQREKPIWRSWSRLNNSIENVNKCEKADVKKHSEVSDKSEERSSHPCTKSSESSIDEQQEGTQLTPIMSSKPEVPILLEKLKLPVQSKMSKKQRTTQFTTLPLLKGIKHKVQELSRFVSNLIV